MPYLRLLLLLIVFLLACGPAATAPPGPQTKPTTPPASAVGAVAPGGCGLGVPPPTAGQPCPDTPAWPLGAPTKTTGCVMHKAAAGAPLPDPASTPGRTNTTLTTERSCSTSFRTMPYR